MYTGILFYLVRSHYRTWLPWATMVIIFQEARKAFLTMWILLGSYFLKLDLVCIWPNIETISWINGWRIPISNVVHRQFTSETTEDVSPHANFWMKYRYEAPRWLGGKLMEENHSTGHWTLGVLIIWSCWKNDLWLLRAKLFQRVLAQAKNGDKFVWEEKFLQSMGRPKQALKVPCFFSF